MNLTAHPLVVAAELAWKQESLGRANLAGQLPRQHGNGGGWHLPRALNRPAGPRPQHRPRPA